jgi:4-amino-4-deoxy-L-arabinose transferase-like glycosyltransferase
MDRPAVGGYRVTHGFVPLGPATAGPPPTAPIAAGWAPGWLSRWRPDIVLFGATLVAAAAIRLWRLDALGFNSDEAVYAGTAAAIAGDDQLGQFFPIFRAHPILFQSLLSLLYSLGVGDFGARALSAAIGVATVALTYAFGRRLYGSVAGLLAAGLLAVMPYHVVVTRQVLLDGLMCLGATLSLYCVYRYAESISLVWLLAAGAALGLTVLAKETAIVLIGGLYVFFSLTPMVWRRLNHVWLSLGLTGAVVAVYPAVLALSHHAGTGGNYLLWQLVRRSNHGPLFYATDVSPAIGWGALAAAVIGLVCLRRENTWRERLLLSWVVAPVVFFSLWPVKGYQYLLPVAPIVAVLAARTLARTIELAWHRRYRLMAPAQVFAVLLVVGILASLAVPAARQVTSTGQSTFLAGTGGLPGGRSAGQWLDRNVPAGAQILAIGPSMANVLQFYGHRRVLALSINPNALSHNPSYVAVPNPDLALREGEFQYIVWDSYTADRSPFFAAKALHLVDKYHGVVEFTATIPITTGSGQPTVTPIIVIFKVRST